MLPLCSDTTGFSYKVIDAIAGTDLGKITAWLTFGADFQEQDIRIDKLLKADYQMKAKGLSVYKLHSTDRNIPPLDYYEHFLAKCKEMDLSL